MNREAERKRLVELIENFFEEEIGASFVKGFLDKFAENILDDGWMRPPVKVGQTVYYISKKPLNLSVQANTIYEAEVVRIVTTNLGTTLVIQIHNEYGCTEIPNIHEWQKTVYASREQAQKALEGSGEK